MDLPGGFAIDRLEAVIWNDEAFQSLVLDTRQKRLIHALIRQHDTKCSRFDDIISGKGKSLVGLLAGGPGCGKTLTAEAISEVTRRPLCVISAGYLGTTLDNVETNLTQMMDLSKRWNAVLLIDEAEVFLQKRTGTEVERNGLVSIFLRQLEYYQGILILTTNLPGNCDPAFESKYITAMRKFSKLTDFEGRIHFSIWYAELDFNARKTIWKTFLSRALISGNCKCAFSEEDIDKLASYKMNGRQVSLSKLMILWSQADTFLQRLKMP